MYLRKKFLHNKKYYIIILNNYIIKLHKKVLYDKVLCNENNAIKKNICVEKNKK